MRIPANHCVAIACGFLVIAAAACADRPAAQPAGAAVQQADAAIPEVLATVDDERITLDDVRGASSQLTQLEGQYARARSTIIEGTLDSIVRDRIIGAEARKQGKSVDDLITAEAGASLRPSDQEIAAWYAQNQQGLGGRTLDQLRPQIGEYLQNERRNEAAQKLERRLRADRKISIAFEPYRIPFDNAGAPTAGDADAPVTVVEFSDFQCPYCQSVVPTLEQVKSKFKGQVRIVFRQFPIPGIHPFAMKAAEASLCANEQGKFWQLHDAMFQDQKKLSVTDLKATARRLGLDGGKFDACLDSGRFVEQIQKDMAEGQRAGINGTPALFVNGRVIEGGAVPFDVLQAEIQRELDRLKR